MPTPYHSYFRTFLQIIYQYKNIDILQLITVLYITIYYILINTSCNFRFLYGNNPYSDKIYREYSRKPYHIVVFIHNKPLYQIETLFYYFA